MSRDDEVERDAREWANEHLYSMNRHDLAINAYKAGYQRYEEEAHDD